MDASPPHKNPHGEFLRLFLEAERDLYRYVCAILPRPQDARDVVQETALALWENFEQFDGTRPFVPWALRFALNKARQHAAREGRRSFILEDDSLLEKVVAEQEAQENGFEDKKTLLKECLDKLPEKPSRLIRGYYWKKESIEQLAQQARSSTEAVYKQLQRTRQLLSDCVKRVERREEHLGESSAS